MSKSSPEAQLIARTLAGDDDAFAELVEPFESKVYNLALRMCGNREDAFDLAQESFLKAYRSLAKFKGEASFSTWLYRIVSNTCLDQLRRARRAGARVSLDDPIETEGGALHREVADTTFEPEQLALRSEAGAQIKAAVAELPPDHRMAILLREFQELSYEEIAQTMGCSMGTVKSRISRARTALRDRLAARELLPQAGVYSGGLDRRAKEPSSSMGTRQESPGGRAAAGSSPGPARGVDG